MRAVFSIWFRAWLFLIEVLKAPIYQKHLHLNLAFYQLYNCIMYFSSSLSFEVTS